MSAASLVSPDELLLLSSFLESDPLLLDPEFLEPDPELPSPRVKANIGGALKYEFIMGATVEALLKVLC